MTSVDIGHGVTLERRHVAGVFAGVAYNHPKPNGTLCGEAWIPVRPECSRGWDVVSTEPLTLAPSMRCRICGHHGYIQNGRWVPA